MTGAVKQVSLLLILLLALLATMSPITSFGQEPIGLVLDNTRSLHGTAFYRCFSKQWLVSDVPHRFSLDVAETNSARHGRQITITYRQTRVFQGAISSRGSNVTSQCKFARQQVANNLKRLQMQRSIVSLDLANDEFLY